MVDDEHHKKEHKTYMEHAQHKKNKTFEAAAWTFGVIAALLVIALVVSIITHGFTPAAGVKNSLTTTEVQVKTEKYLGDLLSAQGQTAVIDNVKDEGDLYSLKITIAGRTYDSYARKDGSLLFPSNIDMTKPVTPAEEQAAPENVPKTDKPVVELFVMSHCPYGTQSEKGILPAVRALGNSVDFKIKFVYYAMHGEKEVKEQLNQYCIQKEQNDKFIPYLACFLNASDSPGCLASTGVDTTKLKSCTDAADTEFKVTANFNDKASWLSGQFPLFDTDKADNVKYSVQGSPTLVINGVQSSAGRSPSSYLKAICDAYNNAPAACAQTIDTTTPSAGFGYGTSAQATAAGCGV